MRHRQTKGAATDMFGLQPPRHTPTLPRADLASALGQGSEGGQVQPIDASGDDDSFRVGERYRARLLGRSIWAAMCVAVCEQCQAFAANVVLIEDKASGPS